MDIVFELVGWVGMLLLIGAYFLLSIGKIQNGRIYQWFNLIGAFGLLVNGAVHGAWPSVVLNIVWTGIGVFSIIQLERRRRAGVAVSPSADSATI